MHRTTLLLGLSLLLSPNALVQDAKSAKVTALLRGVVTEEDAEALRAALKKVEGIKVNANDIQSGEKGPFGHYFSPPFVIAIADLGKADLGTIAKVVAETKTPQRGEVPPSLNLVLFHPALQVEEADIVALREAVAEVNGVDARAVGGVGGVLMEGRLWVRLDGSGVAKLADIQAALRGANLDLKQEKP
jgi:hypothetical protein